MSDKLNRIQTRHIKKALSYIIQRGVLNDKGIYYLKRKAKSKRHEYSPSGWATQMSIGMREIVRVAYLFSKGVEPTPTFDDKELGMVDDFISAWGRGTNLMGARGFPCEYIDSCIHRQIIRKALSYIVDNGKPNDKNIYYLERSKGNLDRCASETLAVRHREKWIGMKETIRVSCLFALGIESDTYFSDKELNKLSKIWISRHGKEILERFDFPCEEVGRLDPEKIIKKKHAKAAFNYIRKHGQQKWGIWYYKTPPRSKDAGTVEFNGKKYLIRATLRYAYLFALKDKGEIPNEEPPFPAAYKEYVNSSWIKPDRMVSIWDNLGFIP